MNLIDELVNESITDEIKRHKKLKQMITKDYVWRIIQYESFYNTYSTKNETLCDFCDIIRKRIMIETKTINTISELFVMSRVNKFIEEYMDSIDNNDKINQINS